MTPIKRDIIQPTWVIALDVKTTALKTHFKDDEKQIQKCRNDIFTEFYNVVGPYGFTTRVQNSLVFNNNADSAAAYRAVVKGIQTSWMKVFVEKIHLFKVDATSDVSDFLDRDLTGVNLPQWFSPDLQKQLNILAEQEDDLTLFS